MAFLSKTKFIDSTGNFNNEKFLKLLDDARYALKTWKKPAWIVKKTTEQIIIGGISRKEVWQFINKLSNFLNSWIDLKTAFWILHKQVKNQKLKKIVNEIRLNLDHWLSVSDTMRQYQKYFDPFIISLIIVGEKTWTLPRVLTELDKKLLESIELKAKIRWALIYPAILISITLLMVIGMMTFILPKITESFKKTNVEIPGLTKTLMNISDFMINHWIILGGSFIWLIILFFIFRKIYYWQLLFSWISMRLPVFWFIVRQWNIIAFINSFSLLLDSWVLMLEALETSSNVVTNMYYKKEIIKIKNEVETWIKISNAMGLSSWSKETSFSSKYFPEDFVHMVNVWEETWTIWKSMERVWVNYSKELERYIWNLMTMLEPFIIVFVGAMVWTIVIAIMLPFFNLAKVASKM
ncbi:MAG: general secretory pathway component, cryptic [uncultured bacterium (gcode 4)]|uniref:General secretory pathway component, cryptic n=1 Tax=uncultured bacterium (gcode 4) TaxID=1234023 RepID=K2BVY9_9BACT|nr:MAG: general secretory pathway component, cryptic [uncultured bacterium (gcode 4)]